MIQPLGAPALSTSQNVGQVAGWKKLSLRLFLKGMGEGEIAATLGVAESDISAWFVKEEAVKLLQQLAAHEDQAFENIVKGQRVANVLKLINLRDHAKNQNTQLSATKALIDMAAEFDNEDLPKSPEEQKAYLEKLLAEINKKA